MSSSPYTLLRMLYRARTPRKFHDVAFRILGDHNMISDCPVPTAALDRDTGVRLARAARSQFRRQGRGDPRPAPRGHSVACQVDRPVPSWPDRGALGTGPRVAPSVGLPPDPHPGHPVCLASSPSHPQVDLGLPEDLVNLKDRALAGRADCGEPRPKKGGGGGGGGGVASHRPPGGLPHGIPGASQTTHAPVPSRVAPEIPCGRAAPDRRDATRTPACKIDSLAVAGPSDHEKH
jgi:hypothetical protein